MNPIALAVIIVSVIGLVLGIVLAFASVVMAVPVDETAEAIEGVLAGANCGACGFSGCSGYAAALSRGDTKETNLCAPGGEAASKQVAAILGVAEESSVPQTAVVLCHGTTENCGSLMEYHGDMSCRTAAQLFAGGKACQFGCLGLGDCERACPYDAIHVTDKGIAEVDSVKCRACKICIKTCPKGIIELAPLFRKEAVVYCQNADKGGVTRKACKVGCIGCMKCQKACQHDAIKVTNFHAHVDQTKCIGCGDCVAGCPTHCLELTTFGKIIVADPANPDPKSVKAS